MKTMRVLIGLQCSGKSTYAQELVGSDKNRNWIRVNRDDIRLSLFNTEFDPKMEDTVSKVQDSIIRLALNDGKSVVIDNCNIKLSYRNDLYKIAESVGDVFYEEMVFNTSLEECLKRNKNRERKVPEDAIVKFAKAGKDTLWGKYKPRKECIPNKDYKSLVQDQKLPKAIMCDLDGTLSLLNGRDPYDATHCDKDLPNTPVVETCKLFHDAGYTIIFCSGREDKYKEPTERFIENHFVGRREFDTGPFPFVRNYLLHMRKSGDMRKDAIIKREIFDQHIREKYNVLFVLDDRNQVVDNWREMGLTCYQVAPGNF